MEVGQEFTIWESDLLAGLTDPDGDDFYITDTWTDYGSLNFDYDSLTAYLPVSNSQELELDMILESRPGGDTRV